jgi:Icc-related predicted phosphoesterase
MTERSVRLAAVADLHCDRACQGTLHALFDRIAERADLVLLPGDLTHHGTAEEAAVLARELGALRVPVVAVLGNHDHQSGTMDELARVLIDAGVHVLDGDSVELLGIGFAGVKGFCGGFGPRILESWGEEIIKRFVHEAVEEVLKLESALSRIAGEVRVVLTHYAPIAATVVGEPAEIYPFLGCSRLEEPLNRYRVAAAFHGHAHHGTPEGSTSAGVPVYNVSHALLRQAWPDALPVRFVELRVPAAATTTPVPPVAESGARPQLL